MQGKAIIISLISIYHDAVNSPYSIANFAITSIVTQYILYILNFHTLQYILLLYYYTFLLHYNYYYYTTIHYYYYTTIHNYYYTTTILLLYITTIHYYYTTTTIAALTWSSSCSVVSVDCASQCSA